MIESAISQCFAIAIIDRHMVQKLGNQFFKFFGVVSVRTMKFGQSERRNPSLKRRLVDVAKPDAMDEFPPTQDVNAVQDSYHRIVRYAVIGYP